MCFVSALSAMVGAPYVAAVAFVGLEVEVRSLRWQFKDGNGDFGDFHLGNCADSADYGLVGRFRAARLVRLAQRAGARAV